VSDTHITVKILRDKNICLLEIELSIHTIKNYNTLQCWLCLTTLCYISLSVKVHTKYLTQLEACELDAIKYYDNSYFTEVETFVKGKVGSLSQWNIYRTKGCNYPWQLLSCGGIRFHYNILLLMKEFQSFRRL